MPEQVTVYEHCVHLRRTDKLGVLDDLLEIQFIHIPSQTLLKRARSYVTADHATSLWIKKHPTFCHGCRPVGLMQLHKWFWKIKFLEIDRHKEIEGIVRDPDVGDAYVRA